MRSARYCARAFAFTPSRSLTMEAPRPRALVKVIPPPLLARRVAPLVLVSVERVLPIARAMRSVAVVNIVADQKAMGSAVGVLILAKCAAHSSMPWVSRSVAIVSRISRSWAPSAARFRREVARSRVMVGCWIVVWKGKGGERIRGPSSCPPSQQRRWRGRSMPPHRLWFPGGVRSARPSCSARTSPRGSPMGHRIPHMPLRCCTETHRFRSTGQRSRFRSLPNRS